MSDGRRFARSEDDDVEFGFEGGDKFVAGLEFLVEGEGGFPSLFEALGEFAVAFQRQQFLRGPERGGCGAGAGAFKADFAEVEFGGAEVGVGGIVFVEAADARDRGRGRSRSRKVGGRVCGDR